MLMDSHQLFGRFLCCVPPSTYYPVYPLRRNFSPVPKPKLPHLAGQHSRSMTPKRDQSINTYTPLESISCLTASSTVRHLLPVRPIERKFQISNAEQPKPSCAAIPTRLTDNIYKNNIKYRQGNITPRKKKGGFHVEMAAIIASCSRS